MLIHPIVAATYEQEAALEKTRKQGHWSATNSVPHCVRSEYNTRSRTCQELTNL